jgi:subtilisin family serine protease
VGLRQQGVQVQYTSRWFNAAVIISDSATLIKVTKLPFVKNGQTLNRRDMPASSIRRGGSVVNTAAPENLRVADERKNYGKAFNQASMIGAIDMHAAGYRGEGMHVAVFDGGFPGVNTGPAFAHLFRENRLPATFDFVDKDSDVFEDDNHGTHVLSTLAAYQPGIFIGTAYKAHYYLFITEDSRSEHHLEEVNWLLAAEFADSAGVDVINSSLGYNTFDPPSVNYTYADMNGRNTIITRAADYAAAAGMLVVNSAGNEGNKPWRYIGAPADGDSVLSVGAVDSLGRRAAFSSVGPTADGRLKPNLVAQGILAAVVTPSGAVGRANGTSFASPILTGLAVCFWQSNPSLNNMQVIDYLQRTASQATKPDNLLGYGIPNFTRAQALVQEEDEKVLIYPNPLQDNRLQIRLSKEYLNQRVKIEIYNVVAQKLIKHTLVVSPVNRLVQLDVSNLGPGVYSCVITSSGGTKGYKFLKTSH